MATDWATKAREVVDSWNCLDQPSSVLVDAIAALAAEAFAKGVTTNISDREAYERGHAAGVAEGEAAAMATLRRWAVETRRYWSGARDYHCDDCARPWPDEHGWPEGESPDDLSCDVLALAAALRASQE